MASREETRREHNEQKELESLRRVFEQLDRNTDGKIDSKELSEQLVRGAAAAAFWKALRADASSASRQSWACRAKPAWRSASQRPRAAALALPSASRALFSTTLAAWAQLESGRHLPNARAARSMACLRAGGALAVSAVWHNLEKSAALPIGAAASTIALKACVAASCTTFGAPPATRWAALRTPGRVSALSGVVTDLRISDIPLD